MSDFEKWSLLINSAIGFITAAGLFYAGLQLRHSKKMHELTYRVHLADHDWNRRMAAQNAIAEFNQSQLSSALQEAFNYLNLKEPIPLREIEEKINNTPALQNDLHQLLNTYESFARGVIQNIYDEEVIKAARCRVMCKAYRVFQSYIDFRRVSLNAPKAWSDLKYLVQKWGHESNSIEPRASTNVTL